MKTIYATLLSVSMLASASAFAVDSDAVLGGAVGGGIGAAVGSEVGGRDGAILGGALGAAVGTAIATDDSNRHAPREKVIYVEHEHDHRHSPPGHAYGHGVPPGHAKHKKHKYR